LNVVLSVGGEFGRLSHNAEVAIFSIVQEAINNAKKHAKASRIDIEVTPGDDNLTIVIRDNGAGFDVSGVTSHYDQRSSLGLLNMRERAAIADGTLTISSKPSQGTAITLHLPLTSNLAAKKA
jgi:signal transduction histidine kinase